MITGSNSRALRIREKDKRIFLFLLKILLFMPKTKRIPVQTAKVIRCDRSTGIPYAAFSLQVGVFYHTKDNWRGNSPRGAQMLCTVKL
jgi:hypothetical protein